MDMNMVYIIAINKQNYTSKHSKGSNQISVTNF